MNMTFRQAVGLSFALMACGVLVGAVTGLLVVLTRVPDIVVTLATSFVLAGVALAVLNTPGGGAPLDYGNLVQGGLGTDWLPEGVLVLAAVLLVFWLPLRLSRPGLALYAIGSNRNAAFLSGVRVGLDADRGLRDGRPVRLPRRPRPDRDDGHRRPDRRQHLHAAVGRRDRARRGAAGRRRGGLVGPIVGAFVLTQITSQLSYWNVDPNWAQAIQGAVIVVVVMIGGMALPWRERSR